MGSFDSPARGAQGEGTAGTAEPPFSNSSNSNGPNLEGERIDSFMRGIDDYSTV